MSLSEIYEKIQGNYDSVFDLLHSDEKIVKFLVKFSQTDNYELIDSALQNQDYETAFREAHNLKGICDNLGLSLLQKSASAVTEALRGGKPQNDITPLMDALKKDYSMTIDAIKPLWS